MKRAGWARQQRANSPTWNSNYSIDIPHTITLSSLICITPLGSPQQMNAYDLVRRLPEVLGGVRVEGFFTSFQVPLLSQTHGMSCLIVIK